MTHLGAHLGADVAAFVDGQLPPDREAVARRHLAECERCRDLVSEQELLKRRMARCAPAGVPAHLVAALSAVAVSDAPDPAEGQLLRRSVGTVVALVGSSAAVLMLAYFLAPPLPASGDPVAPDFAAYTADFRDDAASRRAPEVAPEVATVTRTASTVNTSAPVAADDETALTDDELDQLTADGWPCHVTLAGDLARIDGRLVEGAVVALRYGDEHVQLHLVEQVGSLDERALEGFQRTTVAGSAVWIREGLPTIVTWQADGVVYTVVTDASTQRIAEVVAQLPTTPDRSFAGRIEDGLERMTSWISAA